MTRLVLHHVPRSRSARTLWLLMELGVPFEVVAHPFDKSLRAPEYLARSPAGRVPALEWDGRFLFETGAIAQLLTEAFSPGDLGRPPDHAERADWLIWLHFAETISTHAQVLTQQHVMLREDWMRSPTVTRLEAARIAKCYDALEARLAGRHWLLDGFSAADIACAQAVDMARRFRPTDAHPAVAAWMDRCAARTASAQALGEPGFYPQEFYPPLEDPAHG